MTNWNKLANLCTDMENAMEDDYEPSTIAVWEEATKSEIIKLLNEDGQRQS